MSNIDKDIQEKDQMLLKDVDVLKDKVLDQRVCLDNMADRVMALEDQVESLSEVTSELVDLVRCVSLIKKENNYE